MNTPSEEQLEQFLADRIFPELEKGRIGWDKPHTETVVRKLKEILDHHPELLVDRTVLLIAAYAHDWGYAQLFPGRTHLTFEEVVAAKPLHMQIGAEKTTALLQNSFFNFLTKEQKERAIHLVRIHDRLRKIKDLDERILVEADTLGGLATDRKHSTFDDSSFTSYLEQLKLRRLPLFVTDYGKQELHRLLEERS